MVIVQLLASPFVGGPEHQVLGIAGNLPPEYRTVFLSFAERGLGHAFLAEARRRGFEAIALKHNTPRLMAAAREVARELRRCRADVLCCNTYKPDLVGWLAARLAGIPVVAIVHGWTGVTWRVWCYERLDRLILRRMDAVVCVSAAQAGTVARAGIPAKRIRIIHNAVPDDVCVDGAPDCSAELQRYFPRRPRAIVGAAGRLSPEKGFAQLVEAASICRQTDPDLGFILFGEGELRPVLEKQIAAHGLQDRLILAGFRTDWTRFLPHLDLVVLPSYTEGLPVVLLEAFAAGRPVVATAVGGIPEVVQDGVNGYLVPAGDAAALARRIRDLARTEETRRVMGARGRQLVQTSFSRAEQAEKYQALFDEVVARRSRTHRRREPRAPVAGRA